MVCLGVEGGRVWMEQSSRRWKDARGLGLLRSGQLTDLIGDEWFEVDRRGT